MKKKFMDQNFILQTKQAQTLYHKYAKQMPIIDYHCHIPPREIAEDVRFENITQVWLGADHYKWRMMRSNGVPENEITGDADDRTKFQRFAESIEKAIGNPMHHWTHLELKRYFGYDGVLNGEMAEHVWNLCNKKLQEENMSARGLIKQSNVRVIGTTDDPIDTLEWHKKIAEDKTFDVKVVPSYRPDKALNINKVGFVEYIEQLSKSADVEIKSVADVKSALMKTMDKFAKAGCKASDHGLDYLCFELADEKELDSILNKALKGESVTVEEAEKYKTDLLLFCAGQYKQRGWVMQLHFNCLRNTNSQMFEKLGPDAGFDTISTADADCLAKLLDKINTLSGLPKTVIYSLNGGDNTLIATIMGSFQTDEAKCKIQLGSAWWFNDTKKGMEEQLTDFAALSVLGNFVGMLTDSRSFLSYTRHEYFRRILCNVIGQWAHDGEYPWDEKVLGKMVQDISFNNANEYFGFNADI